MAYGHKIKGGQRNMGSTCGVDDRARARNPGGGGHSRYEDRATDGVGTSPGAGRMKPGGRKSRSKGGY